MTESIIDFSTAIQLLKDDIVNLKSKTMIKGTWETEDTDQLELIDNDTLSMSKKITFNKPFSEKPEVFLSITGINADNCNNDEGLVYQVTSENITREGFTAKITEWEGCKIHYFCIQWLAFN